jgi:hypothetical protein
MKKQHQKPFLSFLALRKIFIFIYPTLLIRFHFAIMLSIFYLSFSKNVEKFAFRYQFVPLV